LRIDRFDYDLPQDLIAQEPVGQRDGSRLLAIPREGQMVSAQHRFSDLADLLRAGDLVVVNDTRVLPSRLWARRESGGWLRSCSWLPKILRQREPLRHPCGGPWCARHGEFAPATI
jgi:S-adenosylmethionine:tRNA-ribosyltransferase-isomerase (queuine synthetase)